MSGNAIGGKKAAATNKLKYGNAFYSTIGAAGGAASRTGGFAYVGPNGEQYGKALARDAGRIGGMKSKRGPSIKVKEQS